MIAGYQAEKLRSKVTEKIGKYCYAADKKVSQHMFKDDRRSFKISVKLEELAIDKTRAIQEIGQGINIPTPIFCNLQIY